MTCPKKELVLRLCLSLTGSMILAFGLCHIHACADVTEGGILGLTLFFEKLLSFSPAVTSLVLNLLAYLLGLRILGREFLLYSAVSAGGFSLFYGLFDLLPKFLAPLAAHMPFASLVGALFVGVGCGLAVRAGGAPSGDDALAMGLSRKLHLDIRWVYLAFDLVVLLLSLSYIPPRKILWSLLTCFLSGQIVGLLQKKLVKK